MEPVSPPLSTAGLALSLGSLFSFGGKVGYLEELISHDLKNAAWFAVKTGMSCREFVAEAILQWEYAKRTIPAVRQAADQQGSDAGK